MISTRNLTALSTVEKLKMLTQSLAMLDAIKTPSKTASVSPTALRPLGIIFTSANDLDAQEARPASMARVGISRRASSRLWGTCGDSDIGNPVPGWNSLTYNTRLDSSPRFRADTLVLYSGDDAQVSLAARARGSFNDDFNIAAKQS